VLDVETGLLAQLAPRRLDRGLAEVQSALRQLPVAGGVGALEDQDPLQVGMTNDDHDAGTEVRGGHPATVPVQPVTGGCATGRTGDRSGAQQAHP